MNALWQHIQDILGLPAFLINQCNFLPDYVKFAIITCISFIPWLYFLYYVIELIERFVLKHINTFLKLARRVGVFFGAAISVIPESGYQVMASTFYSRKMISKGTLLAFFISCSDDALPLLCMDFSKAPVIIPIVIVKTVVAIVVGVVVDLIFVFNTKIENSNPVNLDLNEPACCDHKLMTQQVPPYWWMHPLIHTFNVFLFATFALIFFEFCIAKGFGSQGAMAQAMFIDSPIQVIGGALFGLIPNSLTSIFLAIAYYKGLISIPTLIAGLISTTGLGLNALSKYNKNNTDNSFITIVLFVTAVVTGLLAYYNMLWLGIGG